MRRLASAVFLVVLIAADVVAQAPQGQAIRVRWPVANALIYADTMAGVELWLAPTMHAAQGGERLREEIHEGFAPDAVDAWTVMTRQLLELSEPLRGDTASYVSSGVLRGRSGTSLVAARLRDGDRLARTIRLLLARPSAPPMLFELEPTDVDTLLSAFERVIPMSRIGPPQAPEPALTSQCVQIPSYGRPRYPEEERRHLVEGEVWIDVVIDSTGRADLSTFHVLLSDASGFERAVLAFLATARYIPAELDHRPVRQRVQQRFSFALSP